MTQPEIVAPVSFQETDTVTLCAPWYVQESEYGPSLATYKPLVNGEETFGAVHEAIENATHSVDIICWGFQPSMYFIRGASHPACTTEVPKVGGLKGVTWHHACIGELLMQKAKQGVKVRVLGWEAPFNAAGVAGEANLPGKRGLPIDDRKMQSATDDQYAYDRKWFAMCSIAGIPMPLWRDLDRPAFASRGFSLFDRAEIIHQARYYGSDPNLSAGTFAALGGAVTHHQKTVLVDYEAPEHAVGFVMGHNTLDEYWDTNAHSALNRDPASKPAPNAGPRGDTPRQDISSQVAGPILEHLHHNFATAWFDATGEDLMTTRDAMALGKRLQCPPDQQRHFAQILRTQAQEGRRDIETLYLQAVNNATGFIYIENQYFRWPPLAEMIKKAALAQTQGGRDPGKHGALHLFVITNVTDDGIGKGTVNTHRMLDSLGRADTMPKITQLQRIEAAKAQAAAQEQDLSELIADQAMTFVSHLLTGPNSEMSEKALQKQRDAESAAAFRRAVLEGQIKAIQQEVLKPEDIPNLKVHICSLVAPDSLPGNWMPVYIHSKLMIVDDVFTTHGSANINTRSMQVDSELNIAHEWASETQALRRRLWKLHTAKQGMQDDPKVAFEAWQNIIKENKKRKGEKAGGKPFAPLVEFHYCPATLTNLD
ncbi:phospholipase [Pseudomonas sp. KU26590]|uniref:phospholipase D-like domain-containing protein n=1 Tax=Pseudomonas sp. KU26590 TaxID=2991051 RepID=UPI00223CD57F|nr:phospholipase D-like domain-containing protein [Pseudomonas sp. KU26590]UZJ62590.1 phospholipase [Pseudomonas sp. KU26590]